MDPRYNSPSGKADPKMVIDGAATVARVMLKAEKPQGTSTGHGVRFTVEEGNHAKRINQDAAPK
jgi:hypothetical protein